MTYAYVFENESESISLSKSIDSFSVLTPGEKMTLLAQNAKASVNLYNKYGK